MSEARQIGHEFVTTPCLWFSRGAPKAQLLGALSWGHRFFGTQRRGAKKSFKDWIPAFAGMTCRLDFSHAFEITKKGLAF